MNNISKILKEILKKDSNKLLYPNEIVREMMNRIPKEDIGEFLVFQAIIRQSKICHIFYEGACVSPKKIEWAKAKAMENIMSIGVGEPQAKYAIKILDDAIEWHNPKYTFSAYLFNSYKHDVARGIAYLIKIITPFFTDFMKDLITCVYPHWIKLKIPKINFEQYNKKVKRILNSRAFLAGISVVVCVTFGIVAGFWWHSQRNDSISDKTYVMPKAKQTEPSPASSEPKETETAKKKAIPKPTSELSLGDISIGYTVEQMYDILGDEFDITDPRKNGDKRYMYPDLEINTKNGIVTAIVSKSGRMSTIRGIHQGSTYQEVRKAYGVSELESAYDGMTLYEYRFQSLDQKSCLLRFAIKNGVVDYISARLATEEPSKGLETKAEGNAAIETLDNYWKAITRKDFNAAYGFATESRKRQMGSMDSFKAGHKDTISSKMVAPKITEATGNTIGIRFSLEARDHVGSRVKLQTFDCTATMKKVDNTWKIDEITAKKNGERFD